MKFIILGCGSSMGVPRPDGYFGNCDPKNKKNYRTRCSALLKTSEENILIDTSPDLRQQLLRHRIKKINRVLYSHMHGDQTHGINDLRSFYLNSRKQIDVYADKYTSKYLNSSFSYIFKSYSKEYPATLKLNKLPKKIGRIGLCHALNTKGGVHSEFTIMREASDSFYLVSAGANQRLDHDWIQKWMPSDGTVQFENLTNSMGVLVVSGPKARELMKKVSSDDFSAENFKWLSAKNVNVGNAPVNAMRVNFVGELGWELHHPIEYQNHIFDKLMEAGKDLGLKPYGIRAMNSLRVEKSYKLVGTELSIEYSPYESGLDRFVHPNKGNFIGLEALNKWREKGFENKLVTMEIHNVENADVLGNNPIYENDKVVGRATGGDFGFRLDKSIALGMVKPNVATTGQKLKIDILGKMYDATILDESPYDPENNLLRA